MDHRDLLTDAASRLTDAAEAVLRDIPEEVLHARPGERGSSIAWLVWHAARQLDVQLAELRGEPEVWADGWAAKTGVERGVGDFGFGDDDAAVATVRVTDAAALLAYVRACVDALTGHVRGLSAADLDAQVDVYDGQPISRGVRLISIIDDAVAHLGQAAYARGIVDGWTIGY